MAAAVEPQYQEFVKPGKRVWIKMRDPDNAPNGRVHVFHGLDDDHLVYAGYQHIGTATYLIFNRVEGVGKKARVATFALNSLIVPEIGSVEEL